MWRCKNNGTITLISAWTRTYNASAFRSLLRNQSKIKIKYNIIIRNFKE